MRLRSMLATVICAVCSAVTVQNVHGRFQQGSCGVSAVLSASQAVGIRLCRMTAGKEDTVLDVNHLVACQRRCADLTFADVDADCRTASAAPSTKNVLHPLANSESSSVICKRSLSCKKWGALNACLGGLPYHSWLSLMISSKFGGGSSFAYKDGKVAADITSKCAADENDGAVVTAVYQVVGVPSIKAEIRKNGPVVASLSIGDAFYAYRAGVLNENVTGSSIIGMHSVILVGWGRDGESDYWLVLNSFGREWGENGMARLAMGVRPEPTAQSCTFAAHCRHHSLRWLQQSRLPPLSIWTSGMLAACNR